MEFLYFYIVIRIIYEKFYVTFSNLNTNNSITFFTRCPSIANYID